MKIGFLVVIACAVLLPTSTSFAKYCNDYSSCEEVIADYPDGNFDQRDGDRDGIPCENVCKSRFEVEKLLRKYSAEKN